MRTGSVLDGARSPNARPATPAGQPFYIGLPIPLSAVALSPFWVLAIRYRLNNRVIWWAILAHFQPFF